MLEKYCLICYMRVQILRRRLERMHQTQDIGLRNVSHGRDLVTIGGLRQLLVSNGWEVAANTHQCGMCFGSDWLVINEAGPFILKCQQGTRTFVSSGSPTLHVLHDVRC